MDNHTIRLADGQRSAINILIATADIKMFFDYCIVYCF